MSSESALQDFLTDVATSVAMGLMPFLGQAIDIYDTVHAAYDLYNAKDASDAQREEAYFNVAMAAIGWIPGPGDGIKKTLKSVNKNPQKYAPLLLDAVRHALYQAGYKVDPHQFLMDSISEGKIKSILDGAALEVQDSSIFKRSPQVVQMAMMTGMSMAQSSLPMMVGIVERKVLTWLKVAPKNTATSKVKIEKVKGSPLTRLKAKAKGVVAIDGLANPSALVNGTINAAQIVIANINQQQESIGEHVADYHCSHKWGKGADKAQHDQGAKSSFKLTDFRELSQLKAGEIKARGRGIDAVWRVPGHTPGYAIAEYKARDIKLSETVMKRLLVVESAQNHDQKPAHRQAQKDHRKGIKTGALPATTPKPELAKSVPKMSHKWIADRVPKIMGLSDADQTDLKYKKNYNRHVIQVVTSEGDAKTHREILTAANGTKNPVPIDPQKHTKHETGVYDYKDVFTEMADDKAKDATDKKDVPTTNKSKNKRKKQ